MASLSEILRRKKQLQMDQLAKLAALDVSRRPSAAVKNEKKSFLKKAALALVAAAMLMKPAQTLRQATDIPGVDAMVTPEVSKPDSAKNIFQQMLKKGVKDLRPSRLQTEVAKQAEPQKTQVTVKLAGEAWKVNALMKTPTLRTTEKIPLGQVTKTQLPRIARNIGQRFVGALKEIARGRHIEPLDNTDLA